MPAQKPAAEAAATPDAPSAKTASAPSAPREGFWARLWRAPGPRRPIGDIFSELWQEQRKQGIFTYKGVIKQQRQLMGTARSRALLKSTLEAAKASYQEAPREPAERLTFEEAVRKHRLTEPHLEAMCDRYKALQVAFYVLSIAALAYAWYLALGPTLLSCVPALATAVAMAVYGYINAFRAWQIKHRSLISFEKALSIPSTYFVL